MTSIDIIKMALKNLAKRKLRTSLTILSVVIGASSIIIMVSLGIALDESFDKQIQQMGNITNIEVNANYNGKTGITTDNINQFKQLEGVQAVTPILRTELRILLNGDKYVGSFSALGIDPSTADLLGYTAIEGRGLNEEDSGTYNVLVNPLIEYGFSKKGKGEPYPKWIPDEDEITPDMEKRELLNQKITITTDKNYGNSRKYLENGSDIRNNLKHKTYKANIVGIANKPEMYGENYVIVPLDTLEKIKKQIDKTYSGSSSTNNTKAGYERVIIKCKDIEVVQEVMNQVKDIGEFNVYSPIEYITSAKKTNANIQVLLGAIGGISLFIAAIGITNTMVMAIYERTREIGIMKVIGARVSDIKKLFLLEAILIGFLGGGIGVLFSHLLSFTINKAGPFIVSKIGIISIATSGDEVAKISSIPFWLSISSLIFASFIGLISGYFPAKRAVKIEALKAIKSE
ncbi:ABC transporter permease [[Clostridium] colinum]|uniref:ABC transporter permease n=1 Tax=[Clostridium] colinum TaxID=36835 RepID=UPI0020250770|nr:FtsX-like permease family protein [[Clostridium] colinum]